MEILSLFDFNLLVYMIDFILIYINHIYTSRCIHYTSWIKSNTKSHLYYNVPRFTNYEKYSKRARTNLY